MAEPHSSGDWRERICGFGGSRKRGGRLAPNVWAGRRFAPLPPRGRGEKNSRDETFEQETTTFLAQTSHDIAIYSKSPFNPATAAATSSASVTALTTAALPTPTASTSRMLPALTPPMPTSDGITGFISAT